MDIYIMNELDQTISNIVINLFECATGPSHFDYTFTSSKEVI